ncbi:MAG TPA: ChaN family lipoprotein [Vicinamibacterales bacterium]|nr:ChaN family lipoprotein [Vicinamibacterales bacterium]
MAIFVVFALVVSSLHAGVARQAQGAVPPGHPVVVPYVPERVYDTRRKTFSDFEVMLADLSRADVVMVGEQHDDPNTHRLQAALLQGLLRRGAAVTVSLEMFERDVQGVLDDYLAGRVGEDELLKNARPWPRYATDYRPLVEMARAHGWPVVASNVPRRFAADVARSGLTAIEDLTPPDRLLVARELECPLDGYFQRFADTMGSHAVPGGKPAANGAEARTERYYYSQCLKDETMAESIVAAFDRQERRPNVVVHFTGAFHSDFVAGTTDRVRRRLPGRRVATLSILPVQDIDTLSPGEEDLARADYLVYTVK